jgi:hypothetical protein
MRQLDYDFHLFTDSATGQDSVLYRVAGGHRLALVDPQAHRFGPIAVPLTVSATPAPRLTPHQAIGRLEAMGWPFAFFADVMTGRGCLVYHRYDGHYGLITPAQ